MQTVFFFFGKSLPILVHSLFKFDVKQYMLQHGFSCRCRDRPSDRPCKFSLLEYSLVGKLSSTSFLTVTVSLAAHPLHPTTTPHPLSFYLLSIELEFLHQIMLEYDAMAFSLTLNI